MKALVMAVVILWLIQVRLSVLVLGKKLAALLALALVLAAVSLSALAQALA
jgi:hypothetical protein